MSSASHITDSQLSRTWVLFFWFVQIYFAGVVVLLLASFMSRTFCFGGFWTLLPGSIQFACWFAEQIKMFCKMRRYSLNHEVLPFPRILFRFTVFWRLVGICSAIDFSLNSSINNHRQRQVDSSISQLIRSINCFCHGNDSTSFRFGFSIVSAWCCWHPSPI